MHFVGVDLAWGQRNPTGIAVLDDAGALVHLGAQRTDDEIVEALRPWVGGDCVVGIDAPLIVRNATGNRPAEAALNKDFARFDAGAHPSNTGKPELSGTPRGAVIAARLGLDIAPDSTSGRRALEVYPHPATVALFRLGRTLKYKNKPGRRMEDLQADLLLLMSLVERLEEADPAMVVRSSSVWTGLVQQVRTAELKRDLRRAEDQVDAVVCAYVALHAVRRPESTTTYGDGHTGYIVTPSLPADLVPAPRPRRTDGDPAASEGQEPESEEAAAAAERVRRSAVAYSSRLPALRETTDGLLALVTSILDDAGINYLDVTARTKSPASFAGKAARFLDAEPGLVDPLLAITDQIGLRVITYLQRDVDAVAELLHEELTVIDDRDMGRETARMGRFGYASRHLLLDLDSAPEGVVAEGVPPGQPAQVQVRTVLQHAWAEFEHAIRYKGVVPEEHASDLDRRFTLAAGLLELADQEFSLIQERLQQAATDPHGGPDEEDPRISPQEIATFLTSQYADAGWSRPDHYAWVSQLLLELGITSLRELAGIVGSVDGEALTERMAYKYPPGAVRRLDDALLAVFGSRYVGLRSNEHRADLLRSRLEKLHALED